MAGPDLIRTIGFAAALTLVLVGSARAQDADAPAPPPTEPTEPTQGSAETPIEDPPERAQARLRYQQGVVFFRAERYREAAAEFEQAFSSWDNPLILYSLGQCYERLLEVARAIDAYSRFLAAVPEDDGRRAEVTAKVETLRLLLATLHVDSNVPASVWANGERVGDAPGDVPLAIGRWEIDVRADGYETHHEVISLAARATETMSVVLAPIATSTTRVIERGGGVPVEVFAVFSAAAGVGIAVATGLGVHTLSLAGAYGASPSRTVQAQADGRAWSTATDITGSLAGALVITAFVLALLTDWDATPDEAPAVTPGVAWSSEGALLVVEGAL